MDINLFATQLVQTGGNGKGGQALGGNALFGIGGLGQGADFWNAILGNLAEAQTTDNKNTNTNLNNTEKNTIQSEKADLALLQLALLGQDPDKSLEDRLSELKIERLALTQENRIAQLTKLIDHLTSGLPQEATDSGTIEALVQRLERRLEKLEAQLETFRNGDFETDDVPFKALIATGLNPQQLTKITDRINEVEEKLGRELTVEDLIAGVGNIIPAPGRNDKENEFTATDALALFVQNNKQNEFETKKNSAGDNIDGMDKSAPLEQDNDVQSSDVAGLGNVVPLQDSNKQQIDTFNRLIDQVRVSQIAPANTQTSAAASNETTMVDGTILPTEETAARLSNADYKDLFGRVKKLIPNFGKLDVSTSASTMPPPSAFTANIQPITYNFADIIQMQSILSDALGFDIQTGAPFNNAMQAAVMATSSTQAGQNHPATQMVSAQISKAAQDGSTRNMTLHLDPPELGRVEIRLEFGEKKLVTAHLVIEKPETFLMLQRDAQALERALQNAGLETDSGSLNFEMASDEYAFNTGRDGSNGGNGSSGGSNEADAEEDIDFIETNMTWDVDPETGHVHYSILA